MIILTEPTTPLIFMRNPVGLSFMGDLCISIQNKYERSHSNNFQNKINSISLLSTIQIYSKLYLSKCGGL